MEDLVKNNPVMEKVPQVGYTFIDYKVQLENNNRKMEELFALMFPGIKLPRIWAYQTLNFLSETKVNPEVLPRVIRGINNVLLGTQKGQVIIHICKETMNVSTRETDEEIKTKT